METLKSFLQHDHKNITCYENKYAANIIQNNMLREKKRTQTRMHMFSEIVPIRHGEELRKSILRNTSQQMNNNILARYDFLLCPPLETDLITKCNLS